MDGQAMDYPLTGRKKYPGQVWSVFGSQVVTFISCLTGEQHQLLFISV